MFAWSDARDPYAILVREIMLQQTQTARVEDKFTEWMARFPTLESLAAATQRDVLLAWSGMGYNRRALLLHKTAVVLVTTYGGNIPDDPQILKTLPGIGRYTSHAIASFAFARRVPIVDVNIRRVLSRLTEKQPFENSYLDENTVWRIAELSLPKRKSAQWNQALMDFGATVCTAVNPSCSECSLADICASSDGMLKTPAAPRQSKPVPRRIYRGRVVEFLRRKAPSHCATFRQIGLSMRPGFSEEHHCWLQDILATLQRDSMIVASFRKKTIDVSTYPSALAPLRITLV